MTTYHVLAIQQARGDWVRVASCDQYESAKETADDYYRTHKPYELVISAERIVAVYEDDGSPCYDRDYPYGSNGEWHEYKPDE